MDNFEKIKRTLEEIFTFTSRYASDFCFEIFIVLPSTFSVFLLKVFKFAVAKNRIAPYP